MYVYIHKYFVINSKNDKEKIIGNGKQTKPGNANDLVFFRLNPSPFPYSAT